MRDYNMDFGKVPPQDVDTEAEILGTCLVYGDGYFKTMDILSPESFYDMGHRAVYESMGDLFKAGEPITLSSVRSQLIKRGEIDTVGGVTALFNLSERAIGLTSLERASRLITEKYIAREVIRVNTENINAAYEEMTDVLELVQKQTKDISDVNDIITKASRSKSVGDIADEVYGELERRRSGKVEGDVLTYFPALDKVITAIEEGECVVVGARPGMGKTTFALQICLQNALNGVPSGFLSGEMTKKSVVKKAMFILSKVVAFRSRRNDALNTDDMKSLFEAGKILKRIPFYVEDCAGNPISQLCAKYYKLVNKHGVKLVVADYLQRFNSDNPRDLDTARVSKIVTELNTVAKKTLCPIIIISQLNREVEKTKPYIPGLVHLRDSGAVEQEADMVMFLWRPGYYDISVDENNNDVRGVLRLIIAKFRGGEPGQTVDLSWNDKMAIAEDKPEVKFDVDSDDGFNIEP